MYELIASVAACLLATGSRQIEPQLMSDVRDEVYIKG